MYTAKHYYNRIFQSRGDVVVMQKNRERKNDRKSDTDSARLLCVVHRSMSMLIYLPVVGWMLRIENKNVHFWLQFLNAIQDFISFRFLFRCSFELINDWTCLVWDSYNLLISVTKDDQLGSWCVSVCVCAIWIGCKT